MQLADEQTLYLADLHESNASPRHLRNTAYGLSAWHDYCSTIDKMWEWESASLDDLLDFKAALEGEPSPLTHRPYSTGTIAQYMSRVIGYYKFGSRRGWYSGSVSEADERVPNVKPSNQRGGPIPLEHLTRLMSLAGETSPLPQTIPAYEPFVLARDQLLLAWGWGAGLRNSEIVGPYGLEAGQFDALDPDPEFPYFEYGITVRGKGSKLRQVAAPTWLVLATKAFLGSSGKHDEPGRQNAPLFTVGSRRLQQITAELCEKAGFMAPAAQTEGETPPHDLGLYRFHDLRHSFAVAMYHAEVKSGSSEPWKAIQVQLGHENFHTTMNIYLRWVGGGKVPYRLASATALLGLAQELRDDRR